MNVCTAILHGELSEEVYMKKPKRFVKAGERSIWCVVSSKASMA